MDARPFATPRDRQPMLSPAQVIALGLVAASLGWAAWLLSDRPIREEAELLAGSVLPSSELALMEAAFDRAQLTDYRTEGGRVYVPRSRQSAYMRALVDAEALPREFGGSLRRALANNSPWQSRAVQAEWLRVATQDELSLVICSMPGIERAAVLYDAEAQPGLAGGSVKTASVSIRTQPDADLDAARVQAIRVLVAASIAGLAPDRVAVTDLRNGRVFAGPLESAADESADPALGRRLAYERVIAAKLRQALAYVKGAVIDVTAEFAPAVPPAPEPAPRQPAARPADANTPAELPLQQPATASADPPALSRGDVLAALRVSIAVPAAYLRAAVASAGSDAAALEAAEQAELGRIRQVAARALPDAAASAGHEIVVVGYPGPVPAPRGSARPAATPPSARAAAPESASQTAPPAHPVSLQEVFDRVTTGPVRLDLDAVPREVLVAAGIVITGLLAGLLFLAGARRRPGFAAAHGAGAVPPQIDWSRLDAARSAESEPDPAPHREYRSAA